MIYRKKMLLASCVAPLALAAGTAHAKDAAVAKDVVVPKDAVAAQDQSTAAPASSGLDDIVVTAQRREQRLQDIPLVVTALSAKMIDQLHVSDAIATSKFVPGMISQHNAGLGSANAYFLRGLGNSLSTATFDAPVTTYVDDIYLTRQNANNYAFFDTERVEILRGPQGTLFGRNTTGGAVSIILRKPSDKFGFSAEATAGSFDRYTGKASIDIPLSSAVRTKISGYVVSDRGYLKDITTGERLNGENNYGVRGDVRLLPTSNLTIDLAAEFTQNSSTYGGLRNIASTTQNPYLVATSLTTPVFYETAAGLPKTNCSTTGNNVNILLTTGKGNCGLVRTFAASANISYKIGSGTLNYIFGYRQFDQGYISQYDASNANKLTGYIIADNGHDDQVSHELKYTGNLFDDRVHLVTGLFYLRETNDDRQTTFSGGTGANFNPIQDQHLLPKTVTAAAYAQADLDITRALTLTLGGRYTYERKNVAYLASTQFAGFGYTSAQVAAFGIPLELKQNRFTPRVAVSYKITPDVLLFASATNGFKSGGWNGTSAAPQNAVAFRPEQTWSFEGGVKSEFLEHKVRLNVTGFLAHTKDLQATAAVLSPITNAIVSLPFNAGTLEVYGAEVESSFQVTPTFSLFANPSIMRGSYLYIVPGATTLTTATKPVRIPPFQFSGGASYMTTPTNFGSVGGTVTYRHNASYTVALLNTTNAPVEDFVDASVRYQTRDEKFTFSFEVSNLTDQKTVTVNFLSLFPGDPRRFTGRVKVKF